MFRGLNASNIDVKGRVTIPLQYRTKLKEQVDGELVVTIDTEERCLLLYPAPNWQVIEEKLGQLPSFSPVSRRIQRLLIGHATDLKLDSHGRVLLPPLLREYAQLDKTAMMVGQGNKIEIWSDGHWQAGRENWISDGLNDQSDIPEELRSINL